MDTYIEYKDTGIEWIGEIPSHWEVKKLKFVAQVNPPKPQKYSYIDEDVIFLPMQKVGDDGSYVSEIRKPISELWSGFTCFTKGDIIIAKITPCFENGKGAHLKNLETDIGFGSTEFHVIRAKLVTPELLYYITRSKLFMVLGEAFMTGAAGQKRVPSDFITEYKLCYPPKLEQVSIANYLDRKTAQIDVLVADKKRLLGLYEEEKTAIINQAVTKGLNCDVPMKDSGIAWLGDIPEHWEVKKLKTIAQVKTGRTPKIQSSKIDFFENGTINWFTPSDFDENNELVESKRKIKQKAVVQGEVTLFPEYSIYLVSIGATIGKVSYFGNKATANQQINIISVNTDICNPLFAYFYLTCNKEVLRFEADYTTLPILNQTKTKNLFFVIPPLEEQQSIVSHVETECKRIDTQIERTKKLIELLNEYRTALISEVVSGKIKVVE